MSKILKTLTFFIVLIIALSLYDVTSIDDKYINRSTLNVDINNARNPQVKKYLEP